MHKRSIAVLMGPTGTGKSALALAVAQSTRTVIINADAMQMVRDLRIITARPTVQEEAQAEHALYGVLPASEPTSAARWLSLVGPVIERAWKENKLPLLVGGTGMYITSLRNGLAKIPPTPESIRSKVRSMHATELYEALKERDAASAAQFKPGDTQRLARALEVIDATGQSIQSWQAQKTTPLFPDASFKSFTLSLPREKLYTRLNTRFEKMMEAGALDEVRALKDRNLSADTPILRAHGVPELIAHLNGPLSLADATLKAQQNTRNYAKRQLTWLRHQAADVIELYAENQQDSLERMVAEIQN